ncbi:BLUF domain-containing protein [Aporhodopirellula aestuarii]|uniref:BLUF domain-containing protein n=1 Tax=Aporhodopirellula aestuarii TaxID=2950107 RepID=A0ABT0TZ82_9BACT|nr:BLUF domain-containing protein [Aporhodopirellula aestuarii]MCM2369916.1 BLUF domain-containing protein [Aporhodopirellula aestuarii]
MYQRILYTSRATDQVSIRSVYDIIRTAHNRNSEFGVTGGLLFLDGYFIQMLEGTPYAVQTRFSRIVRDPRHDQLTIRLNEKTPELMFPSDWMALRSKPEIAVDVFIEHRYQPGLPSDQFSGEEIKAFMASCFFEPAVV